MTTSAPPPRATLSWPPHPDYRQAAAEATGWGRRGLLRRPASEADQDPDCIWRPRRGVESGARHDTTLTAADADLHDPPTRAPPPAAGEL